MRNWTVALGGCLCLLTTFTHTLAQTPAPELEKNKHEMILVEVVADRPASKRTLDSLLLRRRAPLVLFKASDSIFVFIPHNSCFDRRHFRGQYEERNNGGDDQKRGQGGIALLKKKAGGVSTERREGGDDSERSGGGDDSERSEGGDDSDRQQAGKMAGRSAKGDDSQRNAAGKSKQRTGTEGEVPKGPKPTGQPERVRPTA
jgi:hypothetical protein